MAIQQSQVLPAQFVQDLGQDLAKQVSTIRCTCSINWYCWYITTSRWICCRLCGKTKCCSTIYNKTTKFIRTCTTSSRSRCITNTSTKFSNPRCRFFCTFFTTSTNCRHSSWNSIRWSRFRSNSFPTRCTKFYVPLSITSDWCIISRVW